MPVTMALYSANRSGLICGRFEHSSNGSPAGRLEDSLAVQARAARLGMVADVRLATADLTAAIRSMATI